FPVVAQAEVKTILKSSGEKFKKLRAEHGDDVSHITHVDLDPSAGEPSANIGDRRYFTSEEELERQREAENDHDPMVHASGLTHSEVEKDEIDSMLKRIGSYDPETQKADDLKKIEGVGPVMEQKLHQL